MATARLLRVLRLVRVCERFCWFFGEAFDNEFRLPIQLLDIPLGYIAVREYSFYL